jgi:hypothetical protein
LDITGNFSKLTIALFGHFFRKASPSPSKTNSKYLHTSFPALQAIGNLSHPRMPRPVHGVFRNADCVVRMTPRKRKGRGGVRKGRKNISLN